MVADGIELAVATPHLIDGIYDNRRPKVEALVEQLRARLGDAGIELEIACGAEVDLSSRLVTEPNDDLPLLAGGSAVLLEMPVAVIPHAMNEIIFAVTSRGLLPVLAHPERNELVQKNPSSAYQWIQAGAALQIDGDSLLGVWGRGAKRCAETMVAAGMVHAMASDAHCARRRPPRMREALARAGEIVGDQAVRLVTEGPNRILAGDCPTTPLYDAGGAAPRDSARSATNTAGNIVQRIRRRFLDQL
jgi:protein-tyrosine phosphatase